MRVTAETGGRIRTGGLTLLLLAALCACKPQSQPTGFQIDPAQFSGQTAYEELGRFINLGARDAGTPGAANAARYLHMRLQAMGLSSKIVEFEEVTPRGPVKFRNVVGLRKGTGTNVIIVASHDDTKSGIGPRFQGANDSGSSSAVLLALAGLVAKTTGQPSADVMFAFFDGEECAEHYGHNDGLHGSRHMARQLVESGRAAGVQGVILLDMIGDAQLTVTIPRNSTPRLITMVFDAAREENARTTFSLYPFEIGDDH